MGCALLPQAPALRSTTGRAAAVANRPVPGGERGNGAVGERHGWGDAGFTTSLGGGCWSFRVPFSYRPRWTIADLGFLVLGLPHQPALPHHPCLLPAAAHRLHQATFPRLKLCSSVVFFHLPREAF